MSTTLVSLPTETTSLGSNNANFLKMWTMGVILSSIAYGVTATMSISTLSLIHRSSKNKKEKTHYILISYVVVMIFLATVSIVSGIRANLEAIFKSEIPADLNVGKDENAIIVVLVTWGSDGFLLWRAATLYQGVAMIKRVLMWGLLGILMLSQIVTGVLYILYNFIPALSPTKYSKPMFIAFASTTLAVNWVITGLVVLRVGQYRQQVSTTLGKNYGRPFKKVMVVCIESAMLIILFSTIMLVNNLQGKSPFSLSRLLLVQIYIIAPLLILHRVTQDKMTASEVCTGPPLALPHRRSTPLGFSDSSNWTKAVEVHISQHVDKSHTDDGGYSIEMNRPKKFPVTRPS